MEIFFQESQILFLVIENAILESQIDLEMANVFLENLLFLGIFLFLEIFLGIFLFLEIFLGIQLYLEIYLYQEISFYQVTFTFLATIFFKEKLVSCQWIVIIDLGKVIFFFLLLVLTFRSTFSLYRQSISESLSLTTDHLIGHPFGLTSRLSSRFLFLNAYHLHEHLYGLVYRLASQFLFLIYDHLSGHPFGLIYQLASRFLVLIGGHPNEHLYERLYDLICQLASQYPFSILDHQWRCLYVLTITT